MAAAPRKFLIGLLSALAPPFAGSTALWLASLWLSAMALAAQAPESELSATPLYPLAGPVRTESVDWLSWIEERIPPLEHPRGNRWPLILWDGVGFEPLTPDRVRMLLERGLVQHVRLDPKMIPAARALQVAGAPVIVMEGRGGNWPYDLAGEKAAWAHAYPDEMSVPATWRSLPAPTRFAGWAVAADRIRGDLRRFKAAGVEVAAVWLDYETEPSLASFGAAYWSPASTRLLRAEALGDEAAFFRYRRQLWLQLLSAYVAAPVREVFPAASVTNWVATLSSVERPVLDWGDQPHPPLGPTLFTESCPLAYGVDNFFLHRWPDGLAPEPDQVDRFFLHLLLRQVSDDAYNRARMAPYVGSVPWVARWVPEHPQERTPMMSRAAYREGLRHLWLRGIDGMQVFNPVRPGFEELALQEVEDVARVYGEMLAFRDFLDRGEVMNLDYPGPWDTGVLWSGLRLADEAVVRLVALGTDDGTLELEPWPGSRIELPAPRGGATHRLRRDPASHTVQRQR